MSFKIFYSFLIGLGVYLAILGILTIVKVIRTKRKANKILKESQKDVHKDGEE